MGRVSMFFPWERLMTVRMVVAVCMLMAVAGCTHATLPAPAIDHPANPAAEAAPLPSVSDTLDVTASLAGLPPVETHQESAMPPGHQMMGPMEDMPGMQHGAHMHGSAPDSEGDGQ